MTFPEPGLAGQKAVLESLVGQGPQATVGVDVAQFGEGRIQAVEHDVEVREKESLGIAQHGNRLWQIVEESSRRAGHIDSVQKAQIDERRIRSKHLSVLTSHSRIVARVVVVVVVVVDRDRIVAVRKLES